METVICKTCLRMEVLCPHCEELLRSGNVSREYLAVARKLLDLEERGLSELSKVELRNVFVTDRMMILLLNPEGLQALRGRIRQIARVLEREFGRRIRMVGDYRDIRDFLEDLIYPAPVITVNTIWVPDGTQEIRLIVYASDLRRSGLSKEDVERIARVVKGVVVRVTTV
ncbi:hypothetical protein DRN94_001955 [archaeon]|nr:hypothetical protein [archaeon]